jgi:hypothetical protein
MISTPASKRSRATECPNDRCPIRLLLLPTVCGLLLCQAGCTAVSSTAALRDAVLDTLDGSLNDANTTGNPFKNKQPSAQKIAAEAAVDAAAKAEAGSDEDGVRTDEQNDVVADAATDDAAADEAFATDMDDERPSSRPSERPAESPEVRQRMLTAAVDGAIARLANVGGLDDAARATLLTTLEDTPSDDWPAVIEAFASTLESALPPDAARVMPVVAVVPVPSEPQSPADVEVAGQPEVPTEKNGVTSAAADPTTPDPTPDPTADPTTANDAVAVPPVTEASRQSLAVNNACFASRVRAWGQVERFAADRFQPGQEVIVYFELANLAANASAAGHTTSIDTVLRLVGSDGRRMHEWTFHPIDETCRSRRRDYFVRYLVQFPAGIPAGPCRLELSVTDVVAGTTAQAALPLEIAAGE